MKTALTAALFSLAATGALAQGPAAERTWSPDPAHRADRTFCTETQADGGVARRIDYVSPAGVSTVDQPSERTWTVMGCHRAQPQAELAEAKPVRAAQPQLELTRIASR